MRGDFLDEAKRFEDIDKAALRRIGGSTFAVHLSVARFCVDCEVIFSLLSFGGCKDCPACGSDAAVIPLAQWINRKEGNES